MRSTYKISALVAAGYAVLLSTSAWAGPAETKAEAVCTGAEDISTYKRWVLSTDTCDEGANICTIDRKDGSNSASYTCPARDLGGDSDDDDSGGGGSSPRPILQN